jgi:membrane-associated phospholipid phosphatase
LDAAIDVRVQAVLSAHRTMLSLVRLGDPVPVTLMTASLLLACLATRRWRAATLAAVAVPGAAALTELLLKPLIHRTLMGELSFPSGHATGVFALAATFAVLLVDPPRTRMPTHLRGLLALVTICAAGVIAAAIVGARCHYATDTMGGAAVGIAMVLLTALILDRLPPPRR